jgi:Entner-Doudoroff aldolase
MKIPELLQEQFVIPVLRETRALELEKLGLAMAEGGLKILEITLMSDAAYSVIKKLATSPDLMVGAGTVTSLESARKAIDAGAKFLVSPGLPSKAIDYAHKHSIPFYPGVLTPTEIIQAMDLGCELVKVFPVSAVGGVQYLKSLSGPFPGMKWMATGGVSLGDLKAYEQAGASCVGLGNNLAPQELVNANDWKGLTERARECVKLVKEARRS